MCKRRYCTFWVHRGLPTAMVCGSGTRHHPERTNLWTCRTLSCCSILSCCLTWSYCCCCSTVFLDCLSYQGICWHSALFVCSDCKLYATDPFCLLKETLPCLWFLHRTCLPLLLLQLLCQIPGTYCGHDYFCHYCRFCLFRCRLDLAASRKLEPLLKL